MQNEILNSNSLNSSNTMISSVSADNASPEILIECATKFETKGYLSKAYLLWSKIYLGNNASWAAAKGLLRLADLSSSDAPLDDLVRNLRQILTKWPKRRKEILGIYQKTVVRLLPVPVYRSEQKNLLLTLKELGITLEDAVYVPDLLLQLLKLELVELDAESLGSLWDGLQKAESLSRPLAEALSHALVSVGKSDLSVAVWKRSFQLSSDDWIVVKKYGEALLRGGYCDQAGLFFKDQQRLGKMARSRTFPEPGYSELMLSRHADLLNRTDAAIDYAVSAVHENSEYLGYLASIALKYGQQDLLALVINFHFVYKSSWSFPQAQVHWLAVAIQSTRQHHSLASASYSCLLSTVAKINVLTQAGVFALVRNRFMVVNSPEVRDHPELGKYFRFAPDLLELIELAGCDEAYLENHAALFTLATVNSYSTSPRVIIFEENGKDFRLDEPANLVKVAEIFIPHACFISKEQETSAHAAIRKMFDRLVAGLIALKIPILPRHQYRNGYADPTGMASHVFSYHTHGKRDGDAVHYHFKESHLPGTYHFETGGYSAWSTIASSPKDTKWYKLHDKDKAAKYVKDLHSHMVHHNLSKYDQPQQSEPLPKRGYVVLILQIVDDVVAQFAYIKPAELIRTAVDALRSSGVSLVIKRHPLCRSPMVSELLQAASSESHVVVSTASIHDLFSSAAAVLTTNSGAGFEAIIHGKVVITVGRSDYEGFTHCCKNTEELEEVLRMAARKLITPVQGWQLFIQNYLEEHVQQHDQPDRFMEKLKAVMNEGKQVTHSSEVKIRKLPPKILAGMALAAEALDAAGFESAASLIWERIDIRSCGNPVILQAAMRSARLRGDHDLWLKLRNSGRITNIDFLSSEDVDMAVKENDFLRLSTMMKRPSLLTEAPFCKVSEAYLSFANRLPEPPKICERLLRFGNLPDTLALTVLQSLIHGGKVEKARGLIQHLETRGLSSSLLNKFHELGWKYHAEVGEFDESLNHLRAIKWKTEYQTTVTLQHYVAGLNLQLLPGIRNLVIATDVDFTTPGLGSHARIMCIAQRCAKLPGVRLIIAYYGRIDRPMFLQDLQRQTFTVIPVCAAQWVCGGNEENSTVHETDRFPLTRLSPGVASLIESNFRQLMDLLKPEWVIFEYLWSSFLVDPKRNYTAILDAHDVQSARSLDIDARGLTNFYPVEEEIEALGLSKFDISMAINAADADKFKEMATNVRVICEPHFEDLPELLSIPKRIKRIGFVGGPQQPNVEGINDFILNVWPHAPAGMELHIYGNVCKHVNIPREETKPVFLHGFVDDLANAYSKVDAVIAPLLTGSGLKIKVVEAMSYGRLVLSTTVGAQGIPVEQLSNPIVYQRAQELWDYLLRADKEMLSDAAASGREWLNTMRESSELEKLLTHG